MRSKYRRGLDMVDKLKSGYVNIWLLLLVASVVLVSGASAAALDGASIYASKCQMCHGDLATHNFIPNGITADQITTAFSSGAMVGKGVTLATGEAQAIADAITPPTVPTAPTTPTTPNGASLYATNCESCHGSLATSERIGRTAVQIQDAINTNAGGMSYLSTLTPEQVQAIADALATNVPPSTEPLAIIVPANITNVSTGQYTIVDTGIATTTGGVGSVTITNDAPASGFTIGNTAVTWTAVDSVGTTVVGIQTVTILDSLVPNTPAPAVPGSHRHKHLGNGHRHKDLDNDHRHSKKGEHTYTKI
jgi:mono/diheme cytochrome c family protein